LKGYVEGSGFPLTNIAGRMLPRVVLGQHPYDGVTYTSLERDQIFLKRWKGPRSMVELMKPVIQRFGLTASREVPTDTELSRWHIEALRITMVELDLEIALVLGSGLPTNIQAETSGYLYRLSYELAGEEFAKAWIGDPIVRYSFERRKRSEIDVDRFIRKAMSLKHSPPPEWKSIEVDYEKLESTLDRYREYNVPVYASNAGFEFLVLDRRFDELREVASLIRKKVGNFLLGTHYTGLIIPMVEEAGVSVDGYLTPVNEAGIYMFPTRRLAVEAIKKAGKPVIAIKPLGGGRVRPERAFRYVFQELKIPVAMVGIASLEEAEETLGAAKKVLSPQ
jgi:hypothetical protein